MQTNYFTGCTTLQEVKDLYRSLAKQYHPDRNQDIDRAIMQAINTQYAQAIAIIAKGGTFTDEQAEAEILKAEAYQTAVNKVINLDGINLELVGSWLWVTGNTKQHKDILKAEPAVFKWAKKKTDFSAWFFRTDEYKTTNRGQKFTLEQIRNKYGSQVIKGNPTASNYYKLTA
jgi:hypothetical protein